MASNKTKIATGITEVDIMLPVYGHKPTTCQTVQEVKQVLKTEVLPMINKGYGSNLNVKYKDGELELIHKSKVEDFVESYNTIAIERSVEQILVVEPLGHSEPLGHTVTG